MLYIMLAYSMLFAALSNTVCLFHVLFCIMHSAFSLLVCHNSMFAPFFIDRAMCSLEK